MEAQERAALGCTASQKTSDYLLCALHAFLRT